MTSLQKESRKATFENKNAPHNKVQRAYLYTTIVTSTAYLSSITSRTPAKAPFESQHLLLGS